MQLRSQTKKFGFLEYKNGMDNYFIVVQRTLSDWGSEVYELYSDNNTIEEKYTYYIFENGNLKERYMDDQKEEFLERLKFMAKNYEPVIQLAEGKDIRYFLGSKTRGIEW